MNPEQKSFWMDVACVVAMLITLVLVLVLIFGCATADVDSTLTINKQSGDGGVTYDLPDNVPWYGWLAIGLAPVAAAVVIKKKPKEKRNANHNPD